MFDTRYITELSEYSDTLISELVILLLSLTFTFKKILMRGNVA